MSDTGILLWETALKISLVQQFIGNEWSHQWNQRWSDHFDLISRWHYTNNTVLDFLLTSFWTMGIWFFFLILSISDFREKPLGVENTQIYIWKCYLQNSPSLSPPQSFPLAVYVNAALCIMYHCIFHIDFPCSLWSTNKQCNYGDKQQQRKRKIWRHLNKKIHSTKIWNELETEKGRKVQVPDNQSCRSVSFCVNRINILWRNRKLVADEQEIKIIYIATVAH